ncbi:hypothetical protein [Nostoc sp. TCL26-01]|uniref:hypothetical protein n=1 Tax=Nostoc sp. TCL26-01 TaxID=2576904 RepID=UPI0015C047C6|nr:hypothetical protein [Nostoc sp. TCL26-01]QLE57142.1 hypothetical protein FD725_17405 [Nostoc sp. TCL26-01]
MVFSRQELELLTIPELSLLVKRYGLRPTGTGGQKTSYLTTLMAFPVLALQQLEERRGLIRPTFDQLQIIAEILDQMGTLTPEQSALLRVTFEGRRMEYPKRYDQERLLNLYKVKNHLSEVIELLGIM